MTSVTTGGDTVAAKATTRGPAEATSSHAGTGGPGRVPNRSGRGAELAVAAVMAVAVVVAVVVHLVARDGQDELSPGSALAAAERHFELFNQGDAPAVLSGFTADATFFNSFTDTVSPAFYAERVAWNVAQGTLKTDVACTIEEAVEGVDEVVVSCTHGTHDAVAQAVGAPSVPTETVFLVSSAGIFGVNEFFGAPDFSHVGAAFEAWMVDQQIPDRDAVGFGRWDSIDTAIANGELTARYAAEWAAQLEAEGCGYLDGC